MERGNVHWKASGDRHQASGGTTHDERLTTNGRKNDRKTARPPTFAEASVGKACHISLHKKTYNLSLEF